MNEHLTVFQFFSHRNLFYIEHPLIPLYPYGHLIWIHLPNPTLPQSSLGLSFSFSLTHINTWHHIRYLSFLLFPSLQETALLLNQLVRYQTWAAFFLSYPKHNLSKHPVKSVRINLQPRSKLPFHFCEVHWYQFLKQHVSVIPRHSEDIQGHARHKQGFIGRGIQIARNCWGTLNNNTNN